MTAEAVVTVPLRLQAPPGKETIEASFVAIEAPGTREARTQRDPITLPADITLHLRRGSSWRFALEAEGFWSPPLLLVATDRQKPFELTLYPAARLQGTLQPPRGQALPESLELRLDPSAEAGGAAGKHLPRSTVQCPVEEGRFSCTVPAVPLDLRLSAEGYVPHYFWDLSPAADDEHTLGALALTPGGSVAGWLEVAEPQALEEAPARVVLEPTSVMAVKGAAEAERFERSALETESDAAGFFQLTGVPPGEYRLVATHPGAGEGSHFPLRVEEGRETELPHPVVLHPPAPLEVGVSPPRDPLGRPWEISVMELNRSRTAVRSRLTGNVDEVGFWRSRPLSPGPYLVTLASSDGARWQQEEVAVAGAPGEVAFFLEMVEVEGNLLLGGEPAAGQVWFGGRRGGTRLRMESDDDGEFHGLLPRAGEWRVEAVLAEPRMDKLFTVEVEEPEGGRPARVDLRIGDGRIEGKVVKGTGRGVAGASVWLAERYPGAAGPRIARADAEGEFEFPGVEEGEHILRAYRFTRRGHEASPEVSVAVAEDRATPRVELLLEPQRRLEGVVLSPAGPVPGAYVSVDPSGHGGIVPNATTDVEGRFTLEVPAAQSQLAMTVLPPGFALACLRLSTAGRGELAVPVSDLAGSLRIRGTAVAERGSFRGLTVLKDGVPCGAGGLSRWLNTYGHKGEDLLFSRLASGVYRGCWQDVEAAGGGTPRCDEGWLPPGGELVLELRAP